MLNNILFYYGRPVPGLIKDFPIIREAGTVCCPLAAEETNDVLRAFDGDAHSPIAKRQIQGFNRSSLPQGGGYRGVAKQIEGPTRLLPAQKVDCLHSPLSIVNERKKLAFGRNRDGRGFAVAEGWRAGGEIGEDGSITAEC